MEYFRNQSENFVREIRKIEIYASKSVDFIETMEGIYPSFNNLLFLFEIVPESFNKKIDLKKKESNITYEIDISFPLLKLTKSNIENYEKYFNTRQFAVVLVSNTNKLLLGNSKEPLFIDVFDSQKLDNSGSDEYTMQITGESILSPKIVEI